MFKKLRLHSTLLFFRMSPRRQESHVSARLMTGLQPFSLFAPKRQSDGCRCSELQKRESGQGSPLTSGDTLSRFIPKMLVVWPISGFIFTLSCKFYWFLILLLRKAVWKRASRLEKGWQWFTFYWGNVRSRWLLCVFLIIKLFKI